MTDNMPVYEKEQTAANHSVASAVTAKQNTDPLVLQTLDFLDSIFTNSPKHNFSFRLWDGTEWRKSSATAKNPPSFTIVLNHAASLRRMFLPPSDTRLGLSYTLGDFDIEGDVGGALDLGRHLWETWRWVDTLVNAYKLIRLPSQPHGADKHAPRLNGTVHSEQRDRRAISFHYDVGNDFYRLWLDDRMVYSCGYFRTPNDSIHDAQLRKLDMLCRKLRLKSGERLLDIGCGWGALAIHAAREYGAVVTGVTLSERQVELARTRAESAGVSNLVSFELRDYRRVEGTFDKIVSVGMIEHVGRTNLLQYFTKAYDLLKPGGVFLNHGITLLHDKFEPQQKVRNGFFGRYIFPDGDLQPIPYVLKHAADTGFEIRDVESLREHYALTLKCWHARFDRNEKEIVKIVGRDTFRLWKLYLLSAGWGFKTGLHSIVQTLLYKPDETGPAVEHFPLIRDDWYNPKCVPDA